MNADTNPTPLPVFETLKLSLQAGVARIELDRPRKANAINAAMWRELREAMEWLDATPQARVGILSAAGAHFSAGLDLGMLDEFKAQTADACDGRSREKTRGNILALQDTVTAIERCRKPVIAEIHAACVGGGIDIVTACDMRYCCEDAWFSVKEIDVGLVADVGTLQRLPRLVGEGMARELAYTARRFSGAEAARMRLVNCCHESHAELSAAVADIAAQLAAKSPLCLRGTKEMISYVRDRPVADGLNYIATWNAAMLYSEDLDEALRAARERRAPTFRD
ncbi:crotonase/enoyl-CoA hydratase family protein [Variovorax sp. EBFNA2]|uniref:crotonase/enoyl-CoA hydratase family protein n=1 Tax=Variovorax sp. EBFNA2 TaxID=3342097 RepID=UPI0029C0C49E|nr:crotonase/enoyl-CoA hydratase family protein [Variovorax boronicumulans]WPG36281.1 crotonase/enoyl-CoA hydratase family protein [Variovorax boronicumulans]